MTQQKITIPNSRNEKLEGILHETESREIIVLCHGFLSRKESTIIKNLATAIEKEGISAFRFDFSGNGMSEGIFSYGNYSHETDGDLRSVIQHLSNNMNRVVTTILGHSKGGDVVLLYASKYRDIRNVINLSGRYDMRKGIVDRFGEDVFERIEKQGFIDAKNHQKGKPGYRVTKEGLIEGLNTDMHQACLKIDKECRVLTVHGTEDKTVPVEDAKEFAKIIPNHKLEIVEGAGHSFSEHQALLISIVMKFVKTAVVKNH
ncbi:unnamed protein product [Arabis nemorensis]|uniref:Serine aminopeptidase S33 domain-containing protein n=1 Tax=Arabis nemorensis TaxID=586526 RepID=A0A565CL57_9BRAS|nr:unnamed protein product [Arabis nemorensis]